RLLAARRVLAVLALHEDRELRVLRRGDSARHEELHHEERGAVAIREREQAEGTERLLRERLLERVAHGRRQRGAAIRLRLRLRGGMRLGLHLLARLVDGRRLQLRMRERDLYGLRLELLHDGAELEDA